MKRITLSICLSLVMSACGSKSVPSYNEKMREEQERRIAEGEDIYGVHKEEPSSDVQDSSLWTRAQGGSHLMRNQRAKDVGDLLTIMIDESATAMSSANTDANRESNIDLQGSLGFGRDNLQTRGQIDGQSGFTNEFTGEGSTDRQGQFQAVVQAVVETVLPNGTLFVRGRKLMTVNNEEQEVELTGYVRPDDIRIDNTVESSVMSDANIQYSGSGTIGDKQRSGWGARVLDWVWPF